MNKFLLLLVAFPLFADSDTLNLSVASDRVCVLGHTIVNEQVSETKQVGCFDSKGAKENIAFENPTAIAIGKKLGAYTGPYTCAISNKKVDCKGDSARPIKLAFRDMKDVTLLASGMHDVCAYDTLKGLRCVGAEHPDLLFTTISVDTPKLPEVEHLAVGYAYACAATKKMITCWGGVRAPFQEFQDSRFKKNLTQIDAEIRKTPEIKGTITGLSVGYSHAVVLDGSEPKIWGVGLAEETSLPSEQSGLFAVDAGTMTTSLLAGGAIVRLGKKNTHLNAIADAPVTLANNKALYNNDQTTCGIYDESLICDGAMKINTKHGFMAVDIFNLEKEFQRLSGVIYKWKAPFLRKSAELMGKIKVGENGLTREEAMSRRAFHLWIQSHLIGSISSERFENVVLPRFRSLRERYEYLFREDSPEKNFENARAALDLMLQAWIAMGPFISDPEAINKVEKGLKVALMALHAKRDLERADLNQVLIELKALRDTTKLLAGSSMTKSMGEIIQKLTTFLESVA